MTTSVVTDLPLVTGVVRDPNDDMVVACALEARADYIVTRDKDLLSLGTYEGIRIVTPRQFLDLLERSGDGWQTP
jgi:predicted nucleic acid-binding protein